MARLVSRSLDGGGERESGVQQVVMLDMRRSRGPLIMPCDFVLPYASLLLTICAPGQRRCQRTSGNASTRHLPQRMICLTLPYRSSPLLTSPTTSAWTVSIPLRSSWPSRRSSASRSPTRTPIPSTQVRFASSPLLHASTINSAHIPLQLTRPSSTSSTSPMLTKWLPPRRLWKRWPFSPCPPSPSLVM